ncbi:nitroreductase family protein, partial [Singulisphaera rosea]
MDASPPLSTFDSIARLGSRRRFDPDRPLPDALLKRILHEATRIPSPANLQPWRFLVVREARNR